jgi:biopolymer transport protein ExbD
MDLRPRKPEDPEINMVSLIDVVLLMVIFFMVSSTFDRTLINNSPDTLRNAIVKVAGAKREGPVTIRADASTTHQSVITAMDVLGKLGFSEINIATIPAAPAK